MCSIIEVSLGRIPGGLNDFAIDVSRQGQYSEHEIVLKTITKTNLEILRTERIPDHRFV